MSWPSAQYVTAVSVLWLVWSPAPAVAAQRDGLFSPIDPVVGAAGFACAGRARRHNGPPSVGDDGLGTAAARPGSRLRSPPLPCSHQNCVPRGVPSVMGSPERMEP